MIYGISLQYYIVTGIKIKSVLCPLHTEVNIEWTVYIAP